MGEWKRGDDGGWQRTDDGGAWGSKSWGGSGQWGQTPRTPQPALFDSSWQPPPPMVDAAGTEAYRTGFQDGFKVGWQEAHGQGLSPGQSNRDDHGGRSNKKKRKRWKQLVKNEEDMSQWPIFACQVGKKPSEVVPYPQDIQKKLRAAMEKVEAEGAQEVQYEMAENINMTIRLFTEKEYNDHWMERLKKRRIYDNGDVVGAQWNARCYGEPPGSWDDHATYRPVYQQKSA